MKFLKSITLNFVLSLGIMVGMVACPTVGYASGGRAVFLLIENDGKADRVARATKLYNQRIKEVIKRKQAISPKAKVLPIARPQDRRR